MIYVLPWPKGVRTAPEFIHSGVEDLDRNRNQLSEALERFSKHQGKPFHDHAAFGKLSEKDWDARRGGIWIIT